jgi:hypothetical protein
MQAAGSIKGAEAGSGSGSQPARSAPGGAAAAASVVQHRTPCAAAARAAEQAWRQRARALLLRHWHPLLRHEIRHGELQLYMSACPGAVACRPPAVSPCCQPRPPAATTRRLSRFALPCPAASLALARIPKPFPSQPFFRYWVDFQALSSPESAALAERALQALGGRRTGGPTKLDPITSQVAAAAAWALHAPAVRTNDA